MPAVVELQAENFFPWFDGCKVNGCICGAAGKRLNIYMFAVEKFFASLYSQSLDFVYNLIAAVVAFA